MNNKITCRRTLSTLNTYVCKATPYNAQKTVTKNRRMDDCKLETKTKILIFVFAFFVHCTRIPAHEDFDFSSPFFVRYKEWPEKWPNCKTTFRSVIDTIVTVCLQSVSGCINTISEEKVLQHGSSSFLSFG